MAYLPKLMSEEVALLVLYCPDCEWLGYGQQALVRPDDVLRCPQCGTSLHRVNREDAAVADEPVIRWAPSVN